MDTLPAPILGDDPDQLLTQEQLRSLLGGISDRTIRVWAAKGEAPPAIRLGKHIRYRVGDYRAWLAAKRNQDAA
jgi:predicted DNA-binding transcriptional regulator AlpA